MKTTPLQRATLAAVARAHASGDWYRAARSGERVTLASLYRRGMLVRRAHRGVEGQADAAHEYRVAPVLHELVTLAIEQRDAIAKAAVR